MKKFLSKNALFLAFIFFIVCINCAYLWEGYYSLIFVFGGGSILAVVLVYKGRKEIKQLREEQEETRRHLDEMRGRATTSPDEIVGRTIEGYRNTRERMARNYMEISDLSGESLTAMDRERLRGSSMEREVREEPDMRDFRTMAADRAERERSSTTAHLGTPNPDWIPTPSSPDTPGEVRDREDTTSYALDEYEYRYNKKTRTIDEIPKKKPVPVKNRFEIMDLE